MELNPAHADAEPRGFLIHDSTLQPCASPGITLDSNSITVGNKVYPNNGVYQKEDYKRLYTNLVIPLVNAFANSQSTCVYTFGCNVAQILGTEGDCAGLLFSIFDELKKRRIKFELGIIASSLGALYVEGKVDRKAHPNGIVETQPKNRKMLEKTLRKLTTGAKPKWDMKHDLIVYFSRGKTKLALVHVSKNGSKVDTYAIEFPSPMKDGDEVFYIGSISENLSTEDVKSIAALVATPSYGTGRTSDFCKDDFEEYERRDTSSYYGDDTVITSRMPDFFAGTSSGYEDDVVIPSSGANVSGDVSSQFQDPEVDPHADLVDGFGSRSQEKDESLFGPLVEGESILGGPPMANPVPVHSPEIFVGLNIAIVTPPVTVTTDGAHPQANSDQNGVIPHYLPVDSDSCPPELCAPDFIDSSETSEGPNIGIITPAGSRSAGDAPPRTNSYCDAVIPHQVPANSTPCLHEWSAPVSIDSTENYLHPAIAIVTPAGSVTANDAQVSITSNQEAIVPHSVLVDSDSCPPESSDPDASVNSSVADEYIYMQPGTPPTESSEASSFQSMDTNVPDETSTEYLDTEDTYSDIVEPGEITHSNESDPANNAPGEEFPEIGMTAQEYMASIQHLRQDTIIISGDDDLVDSDASISEESIMSITFYASLEFLFYSTFIVMGALPLYIECLVYGNNNNMPTIGGLLYAIVRCALIFYSPIWISEKMVKRGNESTDHALKIQMWASSPGICRYWGFNL